METVEEILKEYEITKKRYDIYIENDIDVPEILLKHYLEYKKKVENIKKGEKKK